MELLNLLLTFINIFVISSKVSAEVSDPIEARLGFKDIVNTTTFVDKSMFIYEVLQHSLKLLTVPSKFGKSINLDMLKRFLEITVDENGEAVKVETTPNYDLFVKNNLKITKDKNWFEEHFGEYPVMYIDYSPLRGATNSETILSRLKQILKTTFSQHKYLLKNPDLWYNKDGRELFHKYIDETHTKESDIQNGFLWLCRLLYEHFSKNVFIIIDEFDMFLHDMDKETNLIEDSIKLIKEINKDILKDNDYIYYAVVIGDIRKKGDIKVHPRNLRRECVLYDKKFWKYFGINKRELKKLIPKMMNSTQKNNIKSVFEEDARKVTKLFSEMWKFYDFYTPPKTRKLNSFNPLVHILETKS